MNILLIEDDHEVAAAIVAGLREQGYETRHATDGQSGYRLALEGQWQVIIIDRNLPLLDGLSVVRMLRQAERSTPVIFLTTMSGIDDRVHGLEAGGDDYLVKPFAFPELLARVRVLARRPAAAPDKPTQLRAGDLLMDLLLRTAAG